MKILAFDTATSSCSAAVWQDGEIVAYRHKTMARGHAEHLMGMVSDVLKEAGVGFPDLNLLAVTNGPGGFTGLRVGLAAARGISFAGDLACIGVSTLEVVANCVSFAERDGALVLAAIDTKREDIYAQVFTNVSVGSGLHPVGKSKAILPKNLANFLCIRGSSQSNLIDKIVVIGDATVRAIAALRDSGIDSVAGTATFACDARGVAKLAATRSIVETSAESLRPLYLRPPDATIPRNGGRLRP
jgi:tRNA threonylcarbamoyladenosine biosynthesis protein TsaB